MCKLLIAKIFSICNQLFCCKPKHGYNYVQYEDDVVVHNNVLYDMRNINFGIDAKFDKSADRQWRDCDLYEN